MTYWAWLAVTMCVRRLPTRASYAIAGMAGFCAFYCWPRGRRATLRNYRRVLHGAPDGEVRRTARRSLVNYCRYLADFVRFPSLAPSTLVASVSGSESFAALDRALERGKGAIIVCMHFGNWDLGAGATAARGYPVTVVAETFADARLDAMVVRSRERAGMTVLKLERSVPSLVRCLKRNGLLALLIDRPMAGDGVTVDFFGGKVQVPRGPARLALRTGAALVPVAFARVQAGSPEVHVLTDFGIEHVPAGDEEADIRSLTQSLMAAHERFIRQHPDQWYMFREMWPNARRSAGTPA